MYLLLKSAVPHIKGIDIDIATFHNNIFLNFENMIKYDRLHISFSGENLCKTPSVAIVVVGSSLSATEVLF